MRIDYYEPSLDVPPVNELDKPYDKQNKQMRCTCAYVFPRTIYKEKEMYPVMVGPHKKFIGDPDNLNKETNESDLNKIDSDEEEEIMFC